jgi:hypothetical protein
VKNQKNEHQPLLNLSGKSFERTHRTMLATPPPPTKTQSSEEAQMIENKCHPLKGLRK